MPGFGAAAPGIPSHWPALDVGPVLGGVILVGWLLVLIIVLAVIGCVTVVRKVF